MKKVIITLCVVAVVAIFGGRAWWLYQHRETDTNAVKVGLISVTSGLYAKMGHDFNNGVILAIEELNVTSDKKMKHLIEDGKPNIKYRQL